MTLVPHVLPSLAVAPLASVSPSRFSGLKTCPLRGVATTSAGPRELLPHFPKARVGTAFHRVCERAAAGALASETALHSAWEEEIAAQEREMLSHWYESHLVPLAASTRNYQVLRLQCFALSRRWLRARRASTGPGGPPTAEVKVRTPSGDIAGKIDLVRQTPGGPEIIDYKTGTVSEPEDEASGGGITIKAAYQEQLKLYAALYDATYGAWPSRLVIVAADGNEHDVPYTAAETSSLLAEATDLRSTVNEQVSRGCSPLDLARPSPGACKFCSLRPACPAYWPARDDDPAWPVDARGRVAQVHQLGNQMYRVVMENGETTAIRGLPPERFSFLAQDCQAAILCNLREEGAGPSAHLLTGTPLTTGYHAA